MKSSPGGVQSAVLRSDVCSLCIWNKQKTDCLESLRRWFERGDSINLLAGLWADWFSLRISSNRRRVNHSGGATVNVINWYILIKTVISIPCEIGFNWMDSIPVKTNTKSHELWDSVVSAVDIINLVSDVGDSPNYRKPCDLHLR